MKRIVVELEAKRAVEKLSVEAFAEALSVSGATYSRIRRGLYSPYKSARLINGALHRYPELAALVVVESPDEEEGAA